MSMWSWLFGNKKEKLFDHDVDTWNYLGYTKIEFTSNGETVREGYVHFFVNNNGIDRSYKLVTKDSSYFEAHHTFCTLTLPLWKSKERALEDFIDVPSVFLAQYMLKKYDMVWNNDKKEWVKKVDIETEGNVLKVKF